MTDEPSQLPWHLEGKCIYTSHGDFIGEMEHADDARLVVDAVNERAKFEEARMEFPDLRPVIIAAGQRDAAIAERDRLRDLVKRLITVRENVFWRKDEKTGLMYETCLMDEDEARKTVEEAKAAIKEDEE